LGVALLIYYFKYSFHSSGDQKQDRDVFSRELWSYIIQKGIHAASTFGNLCPTRERVNLRDLGMRGN